MTQVNEKTERKATGGGPVPAQPHPENSSERLMKYGANVVLTSLIVLILAGIVIWGAARPKLRSRVDMTLARSYSLKPQTLNIIRDNTKPIRLVSLYAKLRQEPGSSGGSAANAQEQQDFYQPVVDLLEEYKRNGKNIELEVIDPVAEPARLDAWLGEVTRKYGGNVKGYREFLTNFPKALDQIKKQAADESGKMESSLTDVRVTDRSQAQVLNVAYNTVLAFPALLEEIDKAVKDELEKKIPDYKGAVDNLQGTLNTFSRQVGAIKGALEKLRDAKETPDKIKDYTKASVPRWEALKKLADDELAKIKGLGELKMDEVRRKLINPDDEESTSTRTIAVEGEGDIKLINFKDVWTSGDASSLSRNSSGPTRLRFAGEQQITAAILSLTEPKKTKVAFVRAGGQPKLTAGGMPMRGGGGGDYSDIADRLKAYNCEVVEKDLSGQSQMQQQMPMPEPSDEEIKDAIWVVFDESAQSQFGPMPPSPVLGEKLKKHLDEGGSALVLVSGMSLFGGPMGGGGPDDLSAALKDWGIRIRTNVVCVHEKVQAAENSEDFVEQARREPPIFVLNDLGESPVTTPLRALDAAMVPLLPVEKITPPPADVTVTSIIPVPTEPQSWGESDISSLMRRSEKGPTYDPKTDVAGPLFGGAIAEKKGKGRLVVVGNAEFVNNVLLNLRDPKIDAASKGKIIVSRFPGNGELFTNSIFWLSKMDKMMALSPAAMDTARISTRIGPGALAFWRIGVLLIGLPALAVIAGLLVYRSRMD